MSPLAPMPGQQAVQLPLLVIALQGVPVQVQPGEGEAAA